MKKLLIYVNLIILFLALSANPAIALKCGNDLIQEGDTTWEVRTVLTNNGGKIIGKENAGVKRAPDNYDSDAGGADISNAKRIEKWYISVPGGSDISSCYELTFIGLLLKKIRASDECK